ncbi:MAG: hypothetical protein ACHP84_13755 [Caulobacterales bacterium]
MPKALDGGQRRSGHRAWNTPADFAVALLVGFTAAAIVAQAWVTLAPARSDAMLAVRSDPFDVAAVRDLGLAREAAGDRVAADRLMDLAGRLSWRDAPTQMWLFRRDLAHRDMVHALDHADAALRQASDDAARRPILESLAMAATDPAAAPLLAQRLAGVPAWRTNVLFELGRRDQTLGVARSVLVALRAGPTPPLDVEVAHYVQSLVGRGRFVQAFADWRLLSSSPEREQALIRDGDFQRPGDGGPFSWSLGAGAEIGRPPLAGGEMALHAGLADVGDAVMAEQLLVLAPGRYRLDWRALADRGGLAAPPRWSAECAATGAPIAREAGGALAADAWQARGMLLDVPNGECAALWLRLRGVPEDRGGAPSAWFTRMRLAPVAVESGAP